MNRDSRNMEPLVNQATGLLKSLSHSDRLMICCQLRGGEMSVGALEAELGIPQPRLSRELAKLREEGVLEARREARAVYYTLSDKRAHAMVDAICSVMLGKRADPDVRIQKI
ncbi:MAG TPA: metalloregulator ArsR/SmtB family transcription factor [Hyphomonas sp.]|nr:winged helix-turn-helix transcriptional regulator [Hyphomonas sp.]MCA8905023.1 winged helix-turn-helix transcriptional regulator [Hyphomonas sp.]MCB9962228.1 winged helix-turn-helix transcriptional regulator [Hyphomonas sp.]MCB9969874.1 winged helix-turn-helix transcriptional regulator [Hyphomonas sp.]HPE46886.1 metalloregulator ArsR/SmtB family transcription factor [Hyphomonas sp.]